jgi:hypothetical protein
MRLAVLILVGFLALAVPTAAAEDLNWPQSQGDACVNWSLQPHVSPDPVYCVNMVVDTVNAILNKP